ncbi:MAG: ABC transporter permease [Chloroflexota bacterium]
MSRANYFLRRLGLALFVIIGVMIITFFVSRVLPADPVRLFVGVRASEEIVEAKRVEFGLDRPVPVQFISYVGSVLRGDFGISFRTKQSITKDLRVFLPATLELVILSMVLAVLIGIPIGVIGAATRGSAIDQISRVVTIAGVSIPAFWLALLLQMFFFGYLDWLPLGGRLSREFVISSPIKQITGFYIIDGAITGNWNAWRDALWHLILPTAVLATYPISLTARMTRASMLEVMSETYISAARAAGLSQREILFKLALKNAVVPTLTVLGLVFAFSITGAILVEIVFSWPGLGTYVTESILAADFPVVMAITLIVTVIYVILNLVVDFLQAALDPRVRLGSQ